MRHLFLSHLCAAIAAIVAVFLRLDWSGLVKGGQQQAIVVALIAIAALIYTMTFHIKAGLNEIIEDILKPQPVVSMPERVAEGLAD